MELSEGRPLDTEGRLEKEVRVYDLLDQLGITYWRTDHEAAGTMEDCNEIDRILDVLICKNLFLCNRQKTKFYMLMMPGDKQKNYRHRSTAPDFLLHRKNIWRSIWISLRVP